MIYLTGDIHGHLDITRLKNNNTRHITKDDYVIILGDFGLVWNNPQTSTEKYWLSWLREKPWTTLFLDGNHENHELLSELPSVKLFDSDAGRVCESVYHFRRGRVYTIEGSKFFVMGGAQSVDKHLRLDGISWWRQEIPSYMEMTEGIKKLTENKDIDYVLSHTAPTRAVTELNNAFSIFAENLKDTTQDFLQYVWDTTVFKKWFAGHFHVDSDMVIDTKYINFVYDRIMSLE